MNSSQVTPPATRSRWPGLGHQGWSGCSPFATSCRRQGNNEPLWGFLYVPQHLQLDGPGRQGPCLMLEKERLFHDVPTAWLLLDLPARSWPEQTLLQVPSETIWPTFPYVSDVLVPGTGCCPAPGKHVRHSFSLYRGGSYPSTLVHPTLPSITPYHLPRGREDIHVVLLFPKTCLICVSSLNKFLI